MRAAVIEARNRAEPFLSCCIPDLQADCCVGGGVEDAFRDEGCAYGGCGRCGCEGVAHVAVDEGGFSDSCQRRRRVRVSGSLRRDRIRSRSWGLGRAHPARLARRSWPRGRSSWRGVEEGGGCGLHDRG